MIDIIKPIFNNKKEKKGIYCSEHKLENMIDLKHKCIIKNCVKEKIYGFTPFLI